MKRKSDLPELLAPAGSEEALYAAVAAGADAVYLGGKAFGARAFAANFSEEELKRAVAYCHLHGVRLYVTVNTLVYERELPAWLEFCRSLYRMGVDALIVTDLGGISLLRRYLPDMELHASTQMGIHNSGGVAACESLGLSRAVVARECSLSDIRSMVEKAPLEIEVFLHGALCVCHSGQCLFSSLVGGRSGNRGECAQPCRLPYNGEGKYPLSLKDLSLAGHMCDLIDSGVASLKIEGRMKSPDYVYGVTRIYRRLLDEKRNATEAEERELSALFSRDGFTDGYFTAHLGGMTGVRSEAQKEESRALEKGSFAPMRLAVSGEAVFREGEPCRLTLTSENKTVTVYGDRPEKAIRAPLTKEALKERLCKMGNTYLSLSPERLSISLSEGINLSPAEINALRRAAAEAMEKTEKEMPPEAPISLRRPKKTDALKTAMFHIPDVLFSLSKEEREAFDIIFVPLLFYHEAPPVLGVALPPVIMEGELSDVRERLSAAVKRGARYGLISNLSHFSLCREAGLIPIGDFRMNPYSCESAAVLQALGAEHMLASLELTLPRAASVGGVLAYGRAPLMLTERCFVRENAGCVACQSFAFTDRRGMRFPVLREYLHRNLIFNSLPTYMGDKQEELARRGIFHHHFIFSDESAAEIRQVLSAYREERPWGAQVRRIGVSEAKIYGDEKRIAEEPRIAAKKSDFPKKGQEAGKEKSSLRKFPSKGRAPLGAHAKNKSTNGKKRK